MAVGRAKGHRRIGRFEPYFEVAESFLGPLWAAKVLSGAGTGLVALVREVTVTGDASERMLSASRGAMTLTHAGLLRPLEVGRTSEGSVFVATDYLEGETLRALQGLSSVRRRPIDLGVALRVAMDVLEALVMVHRAARPHGVYGGVSPDSIYVDTSGRTSVLDIGLGAVAASLEGFGGQSERIAYLAPEQVDHYSPGVADARTDVFAVGVLLWEMLSNRRLFIGSDRAVAQKVLAGKIPPLDQVKRRGDSDLSPAIVALVARALERDPASRFATVAEMLASLKATGEAPASTDEVAALINAVGETSIERRVDAMRDETGKVHTELLSRVMAPPEDDALTKPEIRLPLEPEANAATRGAPSPQAPRGKPPLPLGAAPVPAVPAAPARPAAPSEATAPGGAPKGPAPARQRFQTMVGLAPPPVVGASPGKVPPPPALPAQPAAGVAAPTTPGPAAAPPIIDFAAAAASIAKGGGPAKSAPSNPFDPEPAREPATLDGGDGYPDSSIEPVGAVSFTTGEQRARKTPLEPVRPRVQDALDLGAAWPPPPEPSPTAGPITPEPPLPRPPHVPGAASVSRSRPRDSQPRQVPSPISISAPRTASMPPTSLFPSKVPPPLLHDPRAKRRAEEQKKAAAPKSGVLVGIIAAVAIVGSGVALGLYVVKSQEEDPQPTVTTPPASTAATAAVAPAPGTTASAPVAAETAAPPIASASAPADTATAPPSAEAALPEAPPALPSATAPAPTVPGTAPTGYRSRPRPRKFVPDDI